MSDDLKPKKIKVCGRHLTVHKKTFGMQLKRFTLMEKAEADPPIDGDGLEAMIRNGFHRITYPSLVACTTGNLPTEEECFDTPQDELDEWLAAARERNEDWFPTPNESAEDEEKKESTQEPIST